MPELPEVETVVRDLRPLVIGKRISAVRRTSTKALRRPWSDAWVARMVDRSVAGIARRGKWIVLDLGGPRLVIHLGMTGQLVVMPTESPLADHTHLVIDLAPGTDQLRFRDARRFGSVTLFDSAADAEAFFTEGDLGPEPFDYDPTVWRQRLSKTRRNLKATLLDQTLISGVGNIYADESLFEAKLHPETIAADLTPAQADRLLKAIVAVLTRAVDKRGSTIRNYVGGSGLAGGYQDEFRVYGREGQPCPRCETSIVAGRLAGRASHYCPACQKNSRSVRQSGSRKVSRQDHQTD